MSNDPRRERDPNEPDPDEVPTPKVSGSYGRWSFFAEECRAVARRLHHEAREREKLLHRIDIKGARRCTELATTALELADAFEAWKQADPGSEVRHGQISKLFDLRAVAEELAPITPA